MQEPKEAFKYHEKKEGIGQEKKLLWKTEKAKKWNILEEQGIHRRGTPEGKDQRNGEESDKNDFFLLRTIEKPQADTKHQDRPHVVTDIEWNIAEKEQTNAAPSGCVDLLIK